jgi:hypothetical protein
MTRIEVFENDDARYKEWVATNWGYVLIQRAPAEYMLHESDCGHLSAIAGDNLTRKPRRWAPIKYELIDWCEAETGGAPLLCSDCM